MLSATFRVALFGLTLLLVPTTRATGDPLPIFGPEKFVRTAGSPNMVVRRFDNCETSARYKLVVINGTADGKNRVTSGTVTVNGAIVARPSDFEEAGEEKREDGRRGNASRQAIRFERPLRIAASNALIVQIEGRPGSLITLSVECVSRCLDVHINQPIVGIGRPRITVEGTVSSTSNEVGVGVNGLRAEVQQGRFAVSGVPLTLGLNQLLATASNACGNQATDTTTISVPAFNPSGLVITATPSDAIAPVTVNFKVAAGLGRPVASISWDFDGDGNPDEVGPALFSDSHTYTTPGLFLASVTVTDSVGSASSETLPVIVRSQAQFEQLLNTQWHGLQGALEQGDVNAALTYIALSQRSAYASVFRQVSQAKLRARALTVDGPLQLEHFRGTIAVLRRQVTLDGRSQNLVIEFVLDGDGLWRVRFF